ncbi:MAG TPA: glycosyltransferase [Aquabacterium sp.]|nr:glycosyltransferase [Aquabacterium sp.]
MRIAYVGRHGQLGTSNDDEGALTHALRLLGHEVLPVLEGRAVPLADLLLFNKWSDWPAIAAFSGPRAFWYWDRVDDPDPTLARRNATRRAWMAEACRVSNLGFCTDGDWVAADKTGKLVWLPQGFDERLQPAVVPESQDVEILLPASVIKCGAAREKFVGRLKDRWGESVCHVEGGVHGLRLASLVARSRVVVCPDAPGTDSYWSNRVYLLAGLGAALLHPSSRGVRDQYAAGEQVMFYRSPTELDDMIGELLDRPSARRAMGRGARACTLACHTYRHRAEELVRVVRERLGI